MLLTQALGVIMILAAFSTAPGEDPGDNPPAVAVHALYADFRDLSLVFEGNVRFVGDESLLRGRSPDLSNRQFQGTYYFRNDHSCLLDLYTKSNGPKPLLRRSKFALFRESLEEVNYVPDSKAPPSVVKTRGALGALDMPESPQRILQFINLLGQSDRPFPSEKWETIDGVNCLVLFLDLAPKAPADRKPTFRYWIDLKRGGHPLKVEHYQGPDLVARVHSIQLEQVKTEQGETVWLPSSGIYESFGWNGTYHDQPVIRETYHVVRETARVNQKLPDRVFSLRWDPDGTAPRALKELQREFETLARRPRPREPRIDAKGVQEALAKSLEEADRQSKMIEASSPARAGWWTATTAIQIAALTVGGLLIVLAIVMRRGTS